MTDDICVVCKHQINHYPEYDYCSEFCSETFAEQKIKFLNMKAGDFGLWPCSESGCIIEDEYGLGGHCGSCTHKYNARIRKELLEKVLEYTLIPIPDALRERIKEAIER